MWGGLCPGLCLYVYEFIDKKMVEAAGVEPVSPHGWCGFTSVWATCGPRIKQDLNVLARQNKVCFNQMVSFAALQFMILCSSTQMENRSKKMAAHRPKFVRGIGINRKRMPLFSLP